MNRPNDKTTPRPTKELPRLENGTSSRSEASGGRAALRRRIAIEPDTRNRSVTGAVLWVVAATLGAALQFAPYSDSMPTPAFYAYLGTTLGMALLCLVVGPRISGRTFRIAEEFAVVTGWAATAALVAATGGASSTEIGLFANFTFYCAYFMEPPKAARQILVGTAVMWAPLIYGFNSLGGSGFFPRALVMTAVLWATAVLIARNRLETERAELRARTLALTDPLTGVANLHTFEDELQRVLAQADEDQAVLGVAFVDVNGLKAANTVFGHAGGDQLIRRTADALVACAGFDDQVARVGGDEFAVLVSGADAERMKTFEAEFAIALADAGRGEEGPAFDLSASIGTAVFPQDGRSYDELMTVADGRMYDSKAALPPRFPTPETAGGRSLSDASTDEGSRLDHLMTGAAPAASMAWLLAATLIGAAAAFSSLPGVHPRMAYAIAGLCVAVAGLLGLVGPSHRQRAENASNLLAVTLAIPAIYATGGAATAILPLVYLIVAHAAYSLSVRDASVRIGAMLGILAATLMFSATTANFAGVMVIVGEVLVIAAVLRWNRVRTDAAERAAIELSRIDALTRLANRRVFEHTLREHAERPGANGAYDRGGLILADVDNFKLVNTSGGHRAGDEVLRMIASVLEGAIGGEATVCRIGGDEFAIIAAEGDSASLMRLAAKCRAAIGAVDWHVLCEPEVTLSIGYATWEHVGAWKDLVVAADLGLRASKDNGKDVVTPAPQDVARRVPRIGPDQALAG